MTSLLVTGAAGFIGSNFVGQWRGRHSQDTIVALDALTYAGHRENLANFANDPAFTFVHGDICNAPLVRDLFARWRFDRVVHLAAESHVDRSIDDPKAFMLTNVIGTQTLLQAALAAWDGDFDGRCFLHVSTDEVYGSLSEGEPPSSEDAALNPTSPYAASKAASDMVAGAYARTYGLPVIVTRCPNNYGPRQFPEKLIPLMIVNALQGRPLPLYGDGLNMREWLYVGDHCAALAAILMCGRVGETYHIGSGVVARNVDLVTALCDVLDRYLAADPALTVRFAQSAIARNARSCDMITLVGDRPGHDRRYALSCAKAETELGVTAPTALADGLSRTVEWYLANESWWRPLERGALGDWMRRHYGSAAKG